MGGLLRVGLVGCGAMGQGHLQVWQRTPGARVTAVCDAVLDRARATADAAGALAFDDLVEMCGSGAIDAVDICTPSGLHAEQGLVAARAGLHVLCEKPLDLDYGKALELVEECESRGLTLACIFQRRTYEWPRAVAEAVHSGEMGRVLSCSVDIKWWRPQSYYDSAGWRGTWRLDGGVLANQAVHALDHMVWTAGPVAEVEYAHIATECHAMEAEDLVIAVVRFVGGGRGVIEATTACNPPLCSRLELVCEHGAAAFDDATAVAFGVNGQDRLAAIHEPAERVGGRSEPMAISMRGHEVLLADFVEAAREGRPPIVDGRQALLSVDALRKIYEKAGAAPARADERAP